MGKSNSNHTDKQIKWEEYWKYIADDLEVNHPQKGHPSTWNKDKFDTFLVGLVDRLEKRIKNDKDLVAILELPKTKNNNYDIKEISFDTFKRVFKKKISLGFPYTKNVFAIYLGYNSAIEYYYKKIDKNDITLPTYTTFSNADDVPIEPSSENNIKPELEKEKGFDFKKLKAKTLGIIEGQFNDSYGHFFKKYINAVYEARPEAQEKFNHFVNQDEKKCFVVIGKAGKGKTTVFCNLALSLTKSDVKGKLPLLLNSPDLKLNATSIQQEIESKYDNTPLHIICDTLTANNTKLLVFIDAINELVGDNNTIFDVFNAQITALLSEIKTNNYPILLSISCRTDFWIYFKSKEWVLKETFSPKEGLSQNPTCELENFPEEKIDSIIASYFKWFGIRGKVIRFAREQCRDPLMLRYLCEAYTNRKSNDKETLPKNLEIKSIRTIETLQRKKVFDTFVKNIRSRMFERVQKTLNTHLPDNKLIDYTTTYLISLSKVMLEKRRSYITINEAFEVAIVLDHHDATLRKVDFFSPKSIFYMFIDEGLILDKYQGEKFSFIFESYFEYSLGRYIAKTWADLLKNKDAINLIKEDLIHRLNEHSQIIKTENFTNLLGAIHYAILVVEDDSTFCSSHPMLYLDLIEVMLSHENSTFSHRQKALSTLRNTSLLSDISDKENHKKHTETHRILELLFEFSKNIEDFVIVWDVESTLVKLAKTQSKIVIEEMEEWTQESGKVLLKLFASQVIARLVKQDLTTTINVIEHLASRKDFKESFWLARTIIFAISEVAMDKDFQIPPKNTKQLWKICLDLIHDEITPSYTKDLAFSILPYLAKDNSRYTSQILNLLGSSSISIWGIWNLVYKLKEWAEFCSIDESSWIWELFDQVYKINNPHINYAIYTTLSEFQKQKFPQRGVVLLSSLVNNQWTPEEIKYRSGSPFSREKTHKTGLVYSPIYLEPTYDNHTECRQRLQAILNKLIAIGDENYNWVQPSEAPDCYLRMVHNETTINDYHSDGAPWPTYLDEVKQASTLFKNNTIKRQDVGSVELRYESFEIAKISTGGMLSAIDYVMHYQAKSAWSLGRPPGHLANNSICILNNIAIGAKYAQERHRVNRILIIDCDAHHGQHTARVFKNDPNVIYFSIHVEGSYSKQEGRPSYTGEDEGEGYTFNVVYPPNTDDKGYEYIVYKLLKPLALEFEPELIMVSAGFDGHFEDELNPDGMFSENAYIELAKGIKLVADALHIKVVGALEGGYGLNSLANSFVHMINEIEGWGVSPEAIGFVDQNHSVQNDMKLKQVKQVVRQRVELMRTTKASNPNYKLFKDEETWSEVLN